MCLTLPKKVVEIAGSSVTVEDYNGARQVMKTLIELAIGDFIVSQRGIVIEKMDKTQAEEILNILQEYGGKIS